MTGLGSHGGCGGDGVRCGGGNDGVAGCSGGLWGGGWVAAVEVEGEEA